MVCECSSFQLEDSSAFAPEVAVLLNLEEDHLDRHGTLERYREAKLRVFANQPPDAVAIAPEGFELPGDARRAGFADLSGMEIRLRGAHNAENAAAAAAAALAAGVPREAVAEALRTFAGVEHRLEEVADVGGVLYVNDSKATNVASAVKGIEAFEGGVHVILGGSLKGGGFTGLRDAVKARCRAAYLIGEAADRLAAGPRRHRPAAPLRHPRAGGRAGLRGGRAGRGGAALAGLRELRPLPRLRAARRAVPRVGPGRGMSPRARRRRPRGWPPPPACSGPPASAPPGRSSGPWSTRSSTRPRCARWPWAP